MNNNMKIVQERINNKTTIVRLFWNDELVKKYGCKESVLSFKACKARDLETGLKYMEAASDCFDYEIVHYDNDYVHGDDCSCEYDEEKEEYVNNIPCPSKNAFTIEAYDSLHDKVNGNTLQQIKKVYGIK